MNLQATKTKTSGPAIKRWSVKDYYPMAEIGLFRNQRVELIEGIIVEMSPRKPPHTAAVHLTADALRIVFGSTHWVRMQEPSHLGPHSAPEPDIAVISGGPRDYANHPTTALLVVEISDTSLAYDRHRKGSLYAKGNIADYWILNLNTRQLEIRRNPFPNPAQRYGFGYRDLTVLTENDVATPLAAPNARIAVKDLLP